MRLAAVTPCGVVLAASGSGGGADDLVALFEQREDGGLERRHLGMEAQDHALLALHFLLAVGVSEEGERGAVGAGGGLDDVGDEALLRLFVEVVERLAREL